MMEFLKKDSANDTTESFTQRVPLGEKQVQSLPYVSQIQELMSMLVQRKAQLKDAKLRQTNLVGKAEQQELRISKIKIAMDHEVEKEQITRTQQEKLQSQITSCKQSIKQLTKCVKTTKGELAQLLEDIIAGKKNKAEVDHVCAEFECLIKDKTAENVKLDEQIQNLQTLIISTQNDVRAKQDELTNLQLEKTDLVALLDFLEEKLKMVIRAKNSALAQSNDLSQQIVKVEQKIHNIKKQGNQIEWSCEQVRTQNCQIQDLNQRLVGDLQAVKKHLATMEKMNQLLQNSLAEYGITGDKVTRMIAAAKTG